MTSEHYRQIVAASNHVDAALAAVETYTECGDYTLSRVLPLYDALTLAGRDLEAEVAHARALLAN